MSAFESLPSPPTSALVAIVIATRNRAALLRGCLAAIAKQTLTPSEIVVVDDGSTDDTSCVLRAFEPAAPSVLRFARNEASAGPAAARNRGVRLTTAPLVAFTDDDATAEPE